MIEQGKEKLKKTQLSLLLSESFYDESLAEQKVNSVKETIELDCRRN